MKKYFLVAKNTWGEITTYRVSFIVWRLRILIHVLLLYFLWSAILPSKDVSFFGYTQSSMLTYILVLAFVSAIVTPTKSYAIGDDIVSGNLSNYLLRPINYLLYWFSKDAGDRVLDVLFSAAELIVLFLLLRPPLFIQTDVTYIVLLIVAMVIATLMYFFFNVLLGFIGFWSHDIWAPRFIFYTVVSFFAGGYFPLDILPQPLNSFFHALPFGFLLYFPVKVYLGQLSLATILNGFLLASLWLLFFASVIYLLWKRGLRSYTAYGR